MAIPAVLFLCDPPTAVGAGTRLSECHLLTEYDVVIIEPTFAGLWQQPTWPRYGVSSQEGDLDALASELAHRHEELERFFARGGVAVVLLGPESVLHSSGYGGDRRSVSAWEFLIPEELARVHMGVRANTGTTYDVLDEGAMSSYLQQRPRWIATVRSGALSTDPFGFPLATAKDGSFVAYEEIIGAGVLFWVPPPSDEGQWHMLVICARQVWSEREALMGDVALAEERALRDQLQTLEAAYRKQRGEIVAALAALRMARLAFLASDNAVERARKHARVATTYGPAKALAAYHDMLELIERQYGGERAAQDALGYSAALARKITVPANDRRYSARHPGADAPASVPPQVAAEARVAAHEILQRFVDIRFARWREQDTLRAPER